MRLPESVPQNQQDISIDLFADEFDDGNKSTEGAEVAKSQPVQSSQSDSQAGSSKSSSQNDPSFAPSPRDALLQKVNSSLAIIGVPPVEKRKLC